MTTIKTLRDVPCLMSHEFRSGKHYLLGGLEYDLTNEKYNSEGDLLFELHDENGWIADYIITKNNLDLIEFV